MATPSVGFRQEARMKLPAIAIVFAGAIAFSIAAFAQSTSAPAPTPAQSGSATAVPVPTGKRMACQSASQALKGQDRRDQMQLCMAQAHLDCLKQAIDQKIDGPQRKDFVKTCVN
jgi:hypothetical protein